MRVGPYRGQAPVRKRRGLDSGECDVSVYDDIQQLISDEETEIESERDAADAAHDQATTQANNEHTDAIAAADQQLKDALDAADQAHEDAVGPLQARTAALESLREQVVQLSAQADQATPPPVDPTAPVDPDPASTTAPATDPATPSETTDSGQPVDSSPEQSTPSTEEPTSSSDTTADPAPTFSPSSDPTDASIPLTADSTPSIDASLPIPLTSTTDLRGVDDSQPIAVPLSTGEIKVVTAADVQAAQDPDLNDDDLTPDQQAVRNSDLP